MDDTAQQEFSCKGKFHAARLASSPRLQRVYRLLSDGGEHSTRDIQDKARVCAVGACVAELRSNGVKIECRQRQEKGAPRWYYRMTKPGRGNRDAIL